MLSEIFAKTAGLSWVYWSKNLATSISIVGNEHLFGYNCHKSRGAKLMKYNATTYAFFFVMIMALGLKIQAAPLENGYYIVQPKQEDTDLNEKVLILIPGGSKHAEEYSNLASLLSSDPRQKLWVVVLSSPSMQPSNFALPVRVNRALAEIESLRGDKLLTEQVYIAGHSMGTIFAQLYKLHKKFAGLITLGSQLPNLPFIGTGTKSFESRLLVIAGEMDGYIPVSTSIKFYREWLSKIQKLDAPTDLEKLYDHAVIIIKGVNHSQFASTKQMKRDFPSSISYGLAQKQIADTITSFLTLAENKGSLDYMVEMSHKTWNLVNPYLITLEKEQTICSNLQARLFDEQAYYTQHNHDKLSEFLWGDKISENDTKIIEAYVPQKDQKVDLQPLKRFWVKPLFCKFQIPDGGSNENICSQANEIISSKILHENVDLVQSSNGFTINFNSDRDANRLNIRSKLIEVNISKDKKTLSVASPGLHLARRSQKICKLVSPSSFHRFYWTDAKFSKIQTIK